MDSPIVFLAVLFYVAGACIAYGVTLNTKLTGSAKWTARIIFVLLWPAAAVLAFVRLLVYLGKEASE